MDIQEIFGNAHYWCVDKNNHLYIEVFTSNKIIHVADSDLAADHPLLPCIIRAMIERGEDTDDERTRAIGNLVYLTRQILKEGPIMLRDDFGFDHKVALVSRIYTPKDAPDNVTLAIIEADTTPDIIEGVNVDIVTLDHWLDLTMRKTTLDQQYPGWATRHAVCENLDLTQNEMSRYVFDNVSVKYEQASVDGVSFE